MLTKMKLFSILCLAASLILPTTSVLAQTTPKLNIQHWVTSNGAEIYFVQAKQLPILDVAVVFAAGSAYDGNKPGLASLTNDMLQQGVESHAKFLNSTQITDAFADTGAIFTASAAKDSATLSLRTLTKPNLFNPSLALFSNIISHPTFNMHALNREQNMALSAIQASDEDPMTVARHAFLKALYPEYPYGNPTEGTFAGVKKITRHDIINFYHQYYVGSNATVAIVGDVSRPEAEAIANSIVGKLPKGQVAPRLSSPPIVPAKNIHINYPTAQTTVFLGEMGINRNDPDYFPLLLANNVLGGGTVSQLFSTVREKYGLSYDVWSSYMPLQHKGPFIISLQTQNKNTDKAIAVTDNILKNFAQKGPTSVELAAAKKYITDSFPLQMTSNSDIVTALTMIGFYHLPLNYVDTYVAKINAVTLPDVQKALAQHLSPQKLIRVTVGGAPDSNQLEQGMPLEVAKK